MAFLTDTSTLPAQTPARKPGLWAAFMRACVRSGQARAIRELSRLSDAQLAQMGMTRATLAQQMRATTS